LIGILGIAKMKFLMVNSIQTLAKWSRQFLISASARFTKNVKGVAAVEFALVAPILIFLLIGSLAVIDGLRARQAYNQSATIIVDLMARQTTVNDGSIDLFFATARSLLGRYDKAANYRASITSIENEFDSDDDPTLSVLWSRTSDGQEELRDEDLQNFNLPTLSEGETVILVSIVGDYTPLFTTANLQLFTLENNAVRRPRFVTQVEFDNN